MKWSIRPQGEQSYTNNMPFQFFEHIKAILAGMDTKRNSVSGNWLTKVSIFQRNWIVNRPFCTFTLQMEPTNYGSGFWSLERNPVALPAQQSSCRYDQQKKYPGKSDADLIRIGFD